MGNRTVRRSLPVLSLCAALGYGQLGPPEGGAAGSTRPAALSNSQATPGSVSAQQNSMGNASVQVSGNYAGAVPGAIPSGAGAIALSLADAIERGLSANLGPLSATNEERAARAMRLETLSELLPNISAALSETVTQVNLAAYGFTFKLPANVNFSIPTVVGPFSYSQAAGSLSQTVFDAVQNHNLRAAGEASRAAGFSGRDARELVVLAVGGTYLQTLASAAELASQQAQVADAQAIYNQAVTRQRAGTNARIDVMRSLVQLQTEQQRLASIDADYRKRKLALARIVGLPLNRELALSDTLSSTPGPVPDAEAEVAEALAKRSDLAAQEAQLRAAKQQLAAAHAERLPSAGISGDYGVLGPNPTSMHGVFAVTGSVNIPIWQGGRVHADSEQAEAAVHQREAELADARRRVEQEVRDAVIEVKTATGQVQLAQSNGDYAAETLTEARDRFNAGVATTVEVVQAEQQVAGAQADYISSLFALNLARLSLARATGGAEAAIPDFLKGVRP